MKLFGLFEKKNKEKVFVAPEIRIQVLILSLMNTYLEQCKGDMVLVKEEEPDLINEYKRLKSLGLKNTENAKLLKIKLDEIEANKNKSDFGKKVLDWVKEMKKDLPDSYLISFDQFFRILKDYRLTTGFLKDYTGIIPSSNILEIEKVMEFIKKDGKNKLLLNLFDKQNSEYYYNHFYYIKRLNYSSDSEEKDCIKLGDIFKQHGSIIKKGTNSDWDENVIGLHRINIDGINLEDIVKSGPLSDFSVKVERMKSTDLMIAAPDNCFSTKFKIQKVPVDPIVFQYCPYGVVIHSVWGEEADDKVLEEYKTLNQKILEL